MQGTHAVEEHILTGWRIGPRIRPALQQQVMIGEPKTPAPHAGLGAIEFDEADGIVACPQVLCLEQKPPGALGSRRHLQQIGFDAADSAGDILPTQERRLQMLTAIKSGGQGTIGKAAQQSDDGESHQQFEQGEAIFTSRMGRYTQVMSHHCGTVAKPVRVASGEDVSTPYTWTSMRRNPGLGVVRTLMRQMKVSLP